jgi:YfiH family protein
VNWRERDGARWLEAELPGARAAFTTRVGGVSDGPYESLNLGLLTEDDPAAVLANRLRLAAALGREPQQIVIGRQVHGAEIAVHEHAQEPSPFSEPGAEVAEVDGHVTADPRLAPLVFVADCLPIALSGPGGVAMLHCGWRGLAAGIVGDGAAAVEASAAAVGPGIGACCYEVGDDVLEAFAALGDGIAAGRMLDLAQVAVRLLRGAGVERIEVAGLCTSCEPELFYSHRRDAGLTGRQAGLAWLDPGSA